MKITKEDIWAMVYQFVGGGIAFFSITYYWLQLEFFIITTFGVAVMGLFILNKNKESKNETL